MKLRLSISRVRGRGAGLGNELIPWARSFLAAQVVGAYALKPAFGLNKRRYWKHFRTPRYDWILHKAMEYLLPVVEFKEEDYIRHGGGDFLDAFRKFADEKNLHQRSKYLLVTEGLWGGYRHISAARDFVLSTLYQSHFAERNLMRIQERIQPNKFVVGMHIRLGDFGAAPIELSSYRGKFNHALPLEWYCKIAKSITNKLGDNVQFLVVSDGTAEQLKPLLDEISAVVTTDIPDSECSDLLSLIKAELLVCSVSSYSAWAAFLSDAPYIWFEPNLQQHQEGFYSIWGHEPTQRMKGSATREAIRHNLSANKALHGRGFPVGIEGILPEDFFPNLLARNEQWRSESDLVQYGVVSIKNKDEPEECI